MAANEGDPLGIAKLTRLSVELGTQVSREAHRAEAFKEAAREVLSRTDKIIELISDPVERQKVMIALAQLGADIVSKQ